MSTKHLNISLLIYLMLIVPVGVIFFFVVARAQTPADIIFPVAELGNCQSEVDCRAYCDELENISACVDFAQRHNLMSPEEIAQARSFAQIGAGPGGCRSKKACEAYCEDASNIEECLVFAEEHQLMPHQELEEAKKVAQALRAGAKLPGGCRAKAECEAYCVEPAHMEECLDFAEKAGFIPPDELAEARKIMPLMMKGEMPGGCRAKEECEAYCEKEENFEECLAFAEKAGFIPPEEAAMVRKTGGRGPGGCRSKEACEAFCNEPQNQETCFNFAQEHGLIPEEELERIKEGMARLRLGIQQAPPEVLSCLQENLGTDIIERIEKGQLTPGPQIGEVVKACFQKFIPELKKKVQEALNQAPPEVMSCLKEEVGEEILEQMKQGQMPPEPEIGDEMRRCFEAIQPQLKARIQEGLSQATPEVLACLEESLGKGRFSEIKAGQMPTFEEGEQLRECFEEMRQRGMAEAREKIMEGLEKMPAKMRACLEEKIGPEILEKIKTGQPFELTLDLTRAAEECSQKFRQEMPALQEMQEEAMECMEELYGADVMEKMQRGEFVVPADMQEKIGACMRGKM